MPTKQHLYDIFLDNHLPASIRIRISPAPPTRLLPSIFISHRHSISRMKKSIFHYLNIFMHFECSKILNYNSCNSKPISQLKART